MYVFFEHHKDADGTVVATDVCCSSYGTSTGINWKTDKVIFEVIRGLLKSPPIASRSYDEDTKIWTYLGTSGFHLLSVLEEAFRKLPSTQLQFREVAGLEDAVRTGTISESKQKKIDPKDFFYNKAPIAQELTKDAAKLRMLPLLGVSSNVELDNLDPDSRKRLYRQAALRLHPDRNGGDGSKMSELNMLWGVYNA